MRGALGLQPPPGAPRLRHDPRLTREERLCTDPQLSAKTLAEAVPLADIDFALVALGSCKEAFGAYANAADPAASNYQGHENKVAVSISLGSAALSIVKGYAIRLSPSFSPSGGTSSSLSWKSSNPSVASVGDSGLVTGLAEGSCAITATTAEGLSASCATTVVEIAGLSLDVSTASMFIGATRQLVASTSPVCDVGPNLAWASDNTSAATVSASGLVTALKLGNAAISVETEGGAHTATCEITVLPIAVTGVSLDADSASMYVGGAKQLTATISPANATNQSVSWSSSDTSVATVSSSGLVTGAKAGSATIAVTTDDGSYEANSKVCIVAVAAVSPAFRHTMILGADGSLWATGDNEDGQLGIGTTTDVSTPTLVLF